MTESRQGSTAHEAPLRTAPVAGTPPPRSSDVLAPGSGIVEAMTPCTPATGRRHPKGYVWAPGGKLAHRAAWEDAHGPIPAGAVVDHLCHNLDGDCRGGITCPHRACDNVEHLQLSTSVANVRDAAASRSTCKAGLHPRTGLGECAECRAISRARWLEDNLEDQRAKARERMRRLRRGSAPAGAR